MADIQELLEREEAAWAEFVAEVNRVPEHRRGEEGVVPGWSVNDLVFHNGRWAGVAAEKLGSIRDTGSAGEDDPDEVWREERPLGRRVEVDAVPGGDVARARRSRGCARGVAGAPRGHRRSCFLVQGGDASTTTRSTRRRSAASPTASASRRSSRRAPQRA